MHRRVAIVAVALCVTVAVLSGQTQSAATQPARGTQLLFLGTAGGPPLRVDRSEPSTLLIVDGRPYLIDCGIGTIRRMLQARVASETINTIFFTHLHADHDLGLADVMANDFFTLNLAASPQTIDIYGPPKTKQLVDAAFQYLTNGFETFAAEPGAIRAGLVNGALRSPFAAHEIQHDGLVFQDDKIRVTTAENSHYALMPSPARDEMKSYSYRIETPDGIVVFTGDTGPSDAVARLAAGADVLVSEVQDEDQVKQVVDHMAAQNHWPPQRTAAMMAHMTKEHLGQKDAGELATKAHVKTLVLDHYDPLQPAAYTAAVGKYFSGQIFAAADLKRYCLGPRAGGASGGTILRECASK